MSKTLSVFLSSVLASTSLAGKTEVPSDLATTLFADAKMVPCPAVICASPTGEVYVGVDKQGSLGKKSNLGYIAKLMDTDNDGKADKKTVFAKIDNPRGLIAVGNKLYCLHCTQDAKGKIFTQQLSVFTDADNDGVADGPAKALVTNIGNPKFLKSRGTDHSTNNIRLAIDGWIYISIGDFGFVGAQGTDGKKLSMHGGGVVRVRPDGSEVETFMHGTRNVYDVAIDPFMNVYSRENTNDGVGWWVRFSHYIQSGEYGYPSLYTNFPEDMIPALGEYGSGSGTGALFLQEPGWPEKYNNAPLMADWGRSHIYIHRPFTDGVSFTQKPEEFIKCSQVADLDVDGSGRMFIAAWDGAGYSGNPNKGFVSRVVPKNWQYKAFPNLQKLDAAALVNLMLSESFTTRVYAQQEILRRNDKSMLSGLQTIASTKMNRLEGKVAAVYTIAQLAGDTAIAELEKLMSQASLKEHVIRCMADRLVTAKKAPIASIVKALDDSNPRVQVAAAVALGRIGDLSAAPALLKHATLPASDTSDVEPKGYKSKTIAKKGQVKISVDISSFKELYLIVSPDGKNGNDHAAWIRPTIILENGKKIDLTTVKWESATQGWGKTLVNKSTMGEPINFGKEKGAKGIGTHSQSVIKFKVPAGAKTFNATGILTNVKGAVRFAVSPVPAHSSTKSKVHSTPNQAMILPHLARQALVAMSADEACIAGLKSDETRTAALSVMKHMHSEKVVDALIAATKNAPDTQQKKAIVEVLIRLDQKEVEYDGSTWWSTRPNPHGPYFYPVDWAGTEKIQAFLTGYYASLNASQKEYIMAQLKRNKAYMPKLNPRPGGPVVSVKKGDKKVGKTSIEDVVLFVKEHKGKPKEGKKIIGTVGCAGCHNIEVGQVIKGPDLAKLGGMAVADLAEAIIKPSATIADSWVTITLKDGTSATGTIVSKDAKTIVLHNIAGQPTKLDATKVASTKPGLNMMSLHLCDDLTLKQFSDLLSYIKSMDKNSKKPAKKK